MIRRNFAEILKNAKIDLEREYVRLYKLFCLLDHDCGYTLFDECKDNFLDLPFRGTCISLDDFNNYYGFNFVIQPENFDLNYLVNFCEYTYNLSLFVRGTHNGTIYTQQLLKVVELIGHKFIFDDENFVSLLVPKNQEAIAVAEIVDDKIAFSVLEYNHHALKGNLMKKKTILKYMADDIEPQRKKLIDINRTLSDQLFQMFQKFVRHNNEKNTYIKSLTENEIEDIYDDIYQMWLLAKLELDNISRKSRFAEILGKINS